MGTPADFLDFRCIYRTPPTKRTGNYVLRTQTIRGPQYLILQTSRVSHMEDTLSTTTTESTLRILLGIPVSLSMSSVNWMCMVSN